MAKNKQKKKKWIRRRHRPIFAVLRGIFRMHTRVRYNYKTQVSKLKSPFLVLINHVTTFDPVFAGVSFKCPVYFCAMDDLFNRKFSPILRYLVAPIPKKKSSSDITAMKDILRVLREGGAVGLFPEGNRVLSGTQWPISEGIAKLVKLSKVPLVLFNIEGGYGSDPRWGVSKRKGKMRGVIHSVTMPDEYNAMSVEQLHKFICDGLAVDDTQSGVKFKSKRRAENIERALYMCPHCGAVSTISSRGVSFKCGNCGQTWEYTEDLHIVPNDKFSTVSEWYHWEQTEIATVAKESDSEIFVDEDIEFYENLRFKKNQKIAGNKITADKDGFTVYGKDVVMRFPFEQMDGVAIVHRNKFDFYFNGETFQVKGNDKFCSIKYLHLYEGVKNV